MWADNISNILHLFEDGQVSRRELVERLTKYTGSLAAAVAAIESAGLANAQTLTCPAGVQVSENDPALISQMLTISGEGGPLFVYQSVQRDWATAARPAVVVIHENAGLSEHIRDVTRRLAKAGYVAVAVDLLSRQGGTQAFDAVGASAAFGRTRPEERSADVLSTIHTIRDQSYVQGRRVGMIGFCAGGTQVYDAILKTDALSAAVAFYGFSVPTGANIALITTPLMMVYGELDRGTTAPIGPLIQGLAQQNKRYEVHIYSNANHAFHNDTSPRYDPEAACDAWAKALAFLNRYLNRA
ncbi:MAG: dienelactone hydrolase family protein [Bryobacteraceae bacterium]|nr:dienelactone hydrolase family protein [Bryobacteraceae bacterium]